MVLRNRGATLLQRLFQLPYIGPLAQAWGHAVDECKALLVGNAIEVGDEQVTQFP